MAWRVYCQALRPLPGTSNFCDWPGTKRLGPGKQQAERKPCPRCGGPVSAIHHPRADFGR